MSRVFTPPQQGHQGQQGQQTTGNQVKVPQDKIAQRAYEKWCQKGRQHGTDVQNWLEAERELQAEFTRTGTFGTRR